LVVYDHGWYSELPADACLKLPALDQEALTSGLRRLAEEPEFRASLGQRGHAYVHTHHSLARAAAAYVAFTEQVLRSGGENMA
jgi:hypothetical protein